MILKKQFGLDDILASSPCTPEYEIRRIMNEHCVGGTFTVDELAECDAISGYHRFWLIGSLIWANAKTGFSSPHRLRMSILEEHETDGGDFIREIGAILNLYCYDY